jgi:hypothetical protein
VRVEVGDARGIVNLAVGPLLVGDGGAVLGDVERHGGIVASYPGEQVVQALRIDLPAHLRLREAA